MGVRRSASLLCQSRICDRKYRCPAFLWMNLTEIGTSLSRANCPSCRLCRRTGADQVHLKRCMRNIRVGLKYKNQEISWDFKALSYDKNCSQNGWRIPLEKWEWFSEAASKSISNIKFESRNPREDVLREAFPIHGSLSIITFWNLFLSFSQ